VSETDAGLGEVVDGLRHQPDLLAAAYQAAEARRSAIDQMMWQAPGLSLTAQAFLLTVGLQSGVSDAGRLLSGLLGFAVAVASIQLLAKHRHHELELSRWLEQVERAAHLPPLNRPADRARVARHARKPFGGSSVRWWSWTLAAFGAADVLVVCSALFSWPHLAG
jgi:hypothetical protein